VPEYFFDAGSHFKNDIVKELLKSLFATPIFATAMRHTTVGLIERNIQNLINGIKLYIDQKGTGWHEYINAVIFNLNTSINTSGYSAYFLNHGVNALLPPDVIYAESKDITLNERIERLNDAVKKVKERNIQAGETSKQYYNRKRKERHYEIGDKVMMFFKNRRVGMPEKLLPKYKGPYIVKEVCSRDNYVIQLLNPMRNERKAPITVHVERLKPYYEALLLPTD